MAKKESQHRELVDGLSGELEKVRKQHEELTTLSRDQVRLLTEVLSLRLVLIATGRLLICLRR